LTGVDGSTVVLVVLATLVAFAAAVGAMALGSRLTGRCLRGSCGGAEAVGPDGESLACASCPNRKRPAS
jgi:hypothetical protein